MGQIKNILITTSYKTSRLITCATAIILGSLPASQAAFAEEQKAEWELGIGAAALDIPFYPGSSQRATYLFPFPHFIYRSERLEVDNGVDATLLKTPRTRFNLSADFGVPVNSEESDAREGMPDLDLVLQVGPSLEITLAGGRFKPSHTRLELPVRAAIATDFSSAQGVGWIFEPRLSYESRRPYKTGFAHLVSGGLRFSTSKLHSYYYDVAPPFATADRPEYRSTGGYSGAFIDYIANWRTEYFIFWGVLRYNNLAGASYDDSPLIEQEDYTVIGAGVTWIFARNL